MRAALVGFLLVAASSTANAEGAFELDVAAGVVDVRTPAASLGLGVGLRYGIARPVGITVRARFALAEADDAVFAIAGGGGYVTFGGAGYAELLAGPGFFEAGKDESDIPQNRSESGVGMALRVRESLSPHVAFAAQAATIVFRSDSDTDARSFELSVALVVQAVEGW